MSCEHVRSRLDDQLDGELGSRESEEVRRHLAECSGCRAELAALEELRRRVEGLPVALAPSRDLWPGIAARLARPAAASAARSPWPAWSRWLGAAAAAVVCAAVITGYLLSRTESKPVQTATQAGRDVGAAFASASGEPHYRQAREQLLAALAVRRDSLSPQTLAVVSDSLRLLDDTIVRISGALEKHPGDSHLDRLLASAYRQELELLQRATRLPRES